MVTHRRLLETSSRDHRAATLEASLALFRSGALVVEIAIRDGSFVMVLLLLLLVILLLILWDHDRLEIA